MTARAALAEALEDHALVLTFRRTCASNFGARLNWSIVGMSRRHIWRTDGIRSRSGNCAKKTAVLVNLKWPEAEKDADPERQAAACELCGSAIRAPSSPAALAKAGLQVWRFTPAESLPAKKKRKKKKKIKEHSQGREEVD